jgi:hypothetical protein
MSNNTGSRDKKKISLLSTTDQRLNQYCFQTVDTSADESVIIATSGVKVVGVLENKPNAGEEATIASMNSGSFRVIAGALVTAGMDVMSDGSGHAVQATGACYVAGTAVTSASAGPNVSTGENELIEVVPSVFKQAS